MLKTEFEDDLGKTRSIFFLMSLLSKAPYFVGNFVKCGVCPRLQVPGEYHKQEAARVHPLQQRGQYPAD